MGHVEVTAYIFITKVISIIQSVDYLRELSKKCLKCCYVICDICKMKFAEGFKDCTSVAGIWTEIKDIYEVAKTL